MSNYNLWHQSRIEDDDISSPWHEFARAFINDEDVKDKIVLEIGCGRGGFSNYLLKRFPTISKLFACDYSESAVNIAKEKFGSPPQVSWRKEDIQNLSFEKINLIR